MTGPREVSEGASGTLASDEIPFRQDFPFGENNSVLGRTVSASNPHVEALTPSTSEGDGIC